MKRVLILAFSFHRMAEESHYLEELPIYKFIQLRIISYADSALESDSSLALPLAGICYVQMVALKQLTLNEGTMIRVSYAVVLPFSDIRLSFSRNFVKSCS